jgi:predicted homoserine dehydrogenase-like protein
LPIGLAHGLKIKRAVGKDRKVTWDDVEFSEKSLAVKVRREMEESFRQEFSREEGRPILNGVGH